MSRPVLLPRALEPSPGQARDWLREELARPAYHHQAPLLQRLADWLQEQWHRLLDLSQGATGLSPLVTALVAAAVIALLAFVLPRVRRERARGGAGPGAPPPRRGRRPAPGRRPVRRRALRRAPPRPGRRRGGRGARRTADPHPAGADLCRPRGGDAVTAL